MNMAEARTVAGLHGYQLDMSRSTLHGSRYQGGILLSGFSINLRTGESTCHALSFGGACLARSVADQILRLAGHRPRGIVSGEVDGVRTYHVE